MYFFEYQELYLLNAFMFYSKWRLSSSKQDDKKSKRSLFVFPFFFNNIGGRDVTSLVVAQYRDTIDHETRLETAGANIVSLRNIIHI
jgi:hypothetical protein